MSTFRIELLCGAGGAEISGVDLPKPLDEETKSWTA